MTSQYDENGIVMDRYADIVTAMNETVKADLGDSIQLSSDGAFGIFRDIDALAGARVNEIVQQVFDAGIIENSSGVHLDGNVGLVGLERGGFSYSTIAEVQLTASKACIVPAGTRYKTANNVNFATDEELVFTSAGTDTVSATCTVPGQIEVGISPAELTGIVNTVNGITAVENLTVAVPGAERQTDPQVKATHTLVTATAGKSDSDSIYESLYEIPVTAAKIIDNDTDEYDGVVPPHNIRVIVIGGTDEDVATAIWNNKSAGVKTFGSESYVCYSETYGNTREIFFDRGTENSTVINIYFQKQPNFPSDGENTISEAMAAIFENYKLGSTVNYDHIKGMCYQVAGIQLVAPYVTISDEYNSAQAADLLNEDTSIPTLDIERDDSGRIIASNINFNEV